MTKSQPAKDKPGRKPDDESAGRASPGTEGGALADEEDIGTEGAGSEPRDTADSDGKTRAPRRDKA
jgi:hypothetical protein